jgi:hypothetical protein
MLNDFNDILILINMGQKLKKNAQYIFYLQSGSQRQLRNSSYKAKNIYARADNNNPPGEFPAIYS